MIDFLYVFNSSVVKVQRNQYIREIAVVQKAYRFTLDIKPTGTKKGWTNVFRATATPTKNCCSYGNRVPAIFFRSDTSKLHICNSINGRGNFYIDEMIPMDKYTTVTIQQLRNEDGKYRYTILLDHKEAYTVINNKPQVFKNVQVFFGDRFYQPSEAMIKNFLFQNLEG